MILHSVGLTATFALAASSFLIPSTISVPHLQAEDFLEIGEDGFPAIGIPAIPEDLSMPDSPIWPVIDDPQGRVIVALDCKGCSMPESGSDDAMTTAIPNLLVMEFTLSEDRKSIRLNGEPVYPQIEAGPVQLFAAQLPWQSFRVSELPEINNADLATERRLSYSAHVKTQKSASDGDAKLIDFTIHIDALGDEEVNVDAVQLKIYQSENGDLHILRPEVIPSADYIASDPLAGLSKCEGPVFLCMFKSLIQSKLSTLRQKLHGLKPLGCHGSMFKRPMLHGGFPKLSSLPVMNKENAAVLDIPQPDISTPSHHHNHHHKGLHRFAMGLHKFVVGFVLPVLIGIVAGVTASLIGMAVGTFIAWLWIRFVRKGKKGPYARVQQQEGGVQLPQEEQKLMAVISDEEAPPNYVEKE